MTQLWSQRQGFRSSLREEFWTAFYTALRSRLIPFHIKLWSPYYRETTRIIEDSAASFMKEHIGHRIKLFNTEESYHRPADDNRVLDYIEVFYLMARHEKLRQTYTADVNTLFRRFNQPFELVEGKVHRRGSELLEDPIERLEDLVIPDDQLLKYLLAAREAFLDAREDRRLEGLRSLWDAFERLKSSGAPDKKTAVTKLIEEMVPYTALRVHVDAIARSLTDIGNQTNIRHSEQRVTIIDQDPVFIEYLFFSCFALAGDDSEESDLPA